MNPSTNKFEELIEKAAYSDANLSAIKSLLLRPDGTEVPAHWSVFKQGEHVVIKNYTFKVAYIGESTLLLEPVGPYIIEDKK